MNTTEQRMQTPLNQVEMLAPSVRRLYAYGLERGEVHRSEVDIARELGLSHSSVRNARRILSAMGLVEDRGRMTGQGRSACWAFLGKPRS